MQKRFLFLSDIPWPGLCLIFIFITLFTGCKAVGPDYKPPDLFPEGSWHAPMQKGVTQAPAASEELAQWWTVLDDPVLTDLISRAVQNNLDVKLALARIRQYRLLKGIEEADRLPTVNASGGASWTGTSNEDGTGTVLKTYSAGLDASWEIDLFGRIQRSIEAADASLSAQQEALRDTLISLVGDLADSYIDVRTAQIRLDVVRQNIDSQTESFQLTQWQYQAGLTDELDVHQARYSLESAKAQIPALESVLSEAMNRVAVLSGLAPGTLHKSLASPTPLPTLPGTIAVGLPADALRRRPDIREAEYELIAQTAQVGVATADLYPELTLSGSIGMDALSPAELFDNILDPSHWARSLAASLSHTLFDAGSIRKNIEVQNSLQEQALIQYESAILSALEEVENALLAYAKEQTRLEHLTIAAEQALAAEDLAKKKYESGLIDFNTVLTSQQTVLSYQSDLATSRGTCVSNLITLYKVLGGGWTPVESDAPTGEQNESETQPTP
ncbi:NodT protein [Desulfobacter hydrogenophilus]|uniref:Efflux transporter outer membrane subunit n=1 Tax=Desulfobacter hydrogenophilus TaxID=2291 RepID=A0A328F6Q1_9BACT|nr:efflux transporter outer membrane subunit [Desulfobacter hydrogenophilus]NDY74132.1 efflux transporter outer membrane subunit [Desulfobacter hydrogenophilus]QBH15198.1 efflux transporter outer membrane subunit [Desulfobacter hydrogenophilus]RAM00254.1 NodT protein [Desulfobacter hydrogenophilus]